MLEAPTIQAAVGRLPDAKQHLAAWGLTMAISLLIESPVIMLLSTAIALSRDRQAFEALRRFMLRLIVVCTALTAVTAFTPLYQFVTLTIMKQPPAIAAAAQRPLQIMLLWTAFIGWRRFYQGAMVRYGHTRSVSIGTGVRLISAVIATLALVLAGRLSGSEVAAVVVMVAVAAEALAATLLARPVLRTHLADPEAGTLPLTEGDIRRYHTPLALTTLLTLLSNPLSQAAVARMPNPTETLAAVPVAAIILLVLRGPGLAVQETAVARAADASQRALIWRFAWLVGLAGTCCAALFLIPAVLGSYLSVVVHAPPSLHSLVGQGVLFGIGHPLLTALGACARGNLMALHQSRSVYHGMVIQLIVQVLFLAVSIGLGWSGMFGAMGAITFGTAAELIFLQRRLQCVEAAQPKAI